MKKFKFSSKNQIMLSLYILIAGLLLCGGSFAYFTSQDEVTNTVKAKTPSIVLYETQWDSKGAEMAKRAVPGMVIPKDPYIYNNSDVVVYVRMKVEISLDGTEIKDTEELYKKIISYIYFNYDYDLETGSNFYDNVNGEYQNPDFYYYNGYFYYASGDTCKPLEQHKATPRLFDCIKLPVMKTDFDGVFDKKFTIKVIAEGISKAIVEDLKVENCAKQF